MSNAKTKTSIPRDLRDLDQWVAWRAEKRNEKTTKVPYQPNGRKADTTNPATWCSFEEARAASRADDFDGFGYVFGADDPFVGIDLDHCHDVEMGATAPWAAKIIDKLDSYTEVSPSGTGVHIIVRATLPEGGRRRDDVEMYAQDRFFCVTGKHLPDTPKTIELRTKRLARLHSSVFRDLPAPKPPGSGYSGAAGLSDNKLIAKARAAKDGKRFTALFVDGRWEHHYASPSNADFALVSRLAFWTDFDPQRVDRLFRRSALMRPKWDERRGRSTYGAQTIAKLAGTTPDDGDSLDDSDDGDSLDALVFRTAREIASTAAQQVPWRAKPWVADGAITEINGKIKIAGKTTFALALTAAVMAGDDFLGERTVKTPVIYVTEQPDASFRKALADAHLLDARNLHILSRRDTRGVEWPEVVAAVLAKADDVRARLVVFDTLSKLAGLKGDEEQSSGHANSVMEPLELLTDQGIAVVPVRHGGKGFSSDVEDAGRGSSAFAGAVDVILSLSRRPGGGRRTMRVIRAEGRFDETPETLVIDYDKKSGTYSVLGTEGRVIEEETKVLIEALVLSGPKLEKDIKDACTSSRSTVRSALDDLVQAGVIARVGEGVKGSPYEFHAVADNPPTRTLLSERNDRASGRPSGTSILSDNSYSIKELSERNSKSGRRKRDLEVTPESAAALPNTLSSKSRRKERR